MKFYDREQELATLKEMHRRSQKSANMTIVTGRRRIGKTFLLLESVRKERFLYFFVSRKSETLLCEEFIDEFKQKLNLPVFGTIKTFRDIIALLLETAKTTPFVLIIDEFQEFMRVNPAIFSDMQNLWDRAKNEAKLHLILCGSVYSMMSKIFEDAKEPLFGRASKKIHLKPFTPQTLVAVLTDHQAFSPENLLVSFGLTGGVAKYLEYFAAEKAFDLDACLDVMLDVNSLFLEEGKTLLVEEFGKEYGVYFSVLSLISASKTSRNEIESILERNVSGYLNRLEHDYNIIKRMQPVFAKPGSKKQKYFIEDNFLNFWFRFFYRYRSAIEIENFAYLKTIIKRDFSTYSGIILERLFKKLMAETGLFNLIGSYWERGFQNEIDIVALNDLEKKAVIVECKLNPKNINLYNLAQKAEKLTHRLKGYDIEHQGLSLEDLARYVVPISPQSSLKRL